jgi:hypothetical protein
MGCACQKEHLLEAKITLNMAVNIVEEDILSPRTLEGRFLIMIKSIKSISPLIKVHSYNFLDDYG